MNAKDDDTLSEPFRTMAPEPFRMLATPAWRVRRCRLWRKRSLHHQPDGHGHRSGGHREEGRQHSPQLDDQAQFHGLHVGLGFRPHGINLCLQASIVGLGGRFQAMFRFAQVGFGFRPCV